MTNAEQDWWDAYDAVDRANSTEVEYQEQLRQVKAATKIWMLERLAEGDS